MSYGRVQRMFGLAQYSRNGLGAFPTQAFVAQAQAQQQAPAQQIVIVRTDDSSGSVMSASGAPVKTSDDTGGFWNAVKSLVPDTFAFAKPQGITPVSLNDGPSTMTIVLVSALGVGLVVALVSLGKRT